MNSSIPCLSPVRVRDCNFVSITVNLTLKVILSQISLLLKERIILLHLFTYLHASEWFVLCVLCVHVTMYMCVHVCMYMLLCVCIYLCVCISLCTCVCIGTCVCMCMSLCACMRAHLCTHSITCPAPRLGGTAEPTLLTRVWVNP